MHNQCGVTPEFPMYLYDGVPDAWHITFQYDMGFSQHYHYVDVIPALVSRRH